MSTDETIRIGALETARLEVVGAPAQRLAVVARLRREDEVALTALSSSLGLLLERDPHVTLFAALPGEFLGDVVRCCSALAGQGGVEVELDELVQRRGRVVSQVRPGVLGVLRAELLRSWTELFERDLLLFDRHEPPLLLNLGRGGLGVAAPGQGAAQRPGPVRVVALEVLRAEGSGWEAVELVEL